MAPRPTEVKAVTALLEGPADDAEELAKRILNQIADLRADRAEWIVVKATADGHLLFAYGPFPTQRKAEDALAKGHVPVIEGEGVGICRLWSPEHAEKAIEAADRPVAIRELPRRHPVPYGPGDLSARRRYERMTADQKKAAFRERTP